MCNDREIWLELQMESLDGFSWRGARFAANMANQTDVRTLGDVLREARVATDVSLRELARRLDIAPSYLSDIENDRRVPAEDVLRAMGEHLGLDFADLMARAGRIGDDAERYLRRHPTAGVLLRRIASAQLSDQQLKELVERADVLAKRKGKS